MKPKTWEEIWDITITSFGNHKKDTRIFEESDFKNIFDLTRENMIPEDEAIRIPLLKDWPEDAKYIRVEFKDINDCYTGAVCEDIPRPEPEWIPHIGDPVFVLQNGYLCVGWVTSTYMREIDVKSGGEIRSYPWHLVKPFSLEKLGKSWEKI